MKPQPNIDPQTGFRIGFCSGHPYADLMGTIQQDGVDLEYTQWKKHTRESVVSELEDIGERDHETEEDWRTFFRDLSNQLSSHIRDQELSRLVDLVDLDSGTFDIDEVADEYMEIATEHCEIESEHWLYEKDGVRIALSMSNGPSLAVELSTHVTPCKQCSPCCPNGGDLDTPVFNVEADRAYVMAYCLPPKLAPTAPYAMRTLRVAPRDCPVCQG